MVPVVTCHTVPDQQYNESSSDNFFKATCVEVLYRRRITPSLEVVFVLFSEKEIGIAVNKSKEHFPSHVKLGIVSACGSAMF